jgi:hypothetical protein
MVNTVYRELYSHIFDHMCCLQISFVTDCANSTSHVLSSVACILKESVLFIGTQFSIL